MLILGIILLIIGALTGIAILWTLGIIVALIGAVLWLANAAGASWGRRLY
jgi:hypothetical protein